MLGSYPPFGTLVGSEMALKSRFPQNSRRKCDFRPIFCDVMKDMMILCMSQNSFKHSFTSDVKWRETWDPRLFLFHAPNHPARASIGSYVAIFARVDSFNFLPTRFLVKTFWDVEQSRSWMADPIWGVPSGGLFPEDTPILSSRVLGCEVNLYFERWNSRTHPPI